MSDQAEQRTPEDLLKLWRQGDTDARDELFTKLYAQMERISGSILSAEGAISLATGDLVSEASIRLIQLDRMEFSDRAHFLAMAARCMRRVLIDRARSKNANKRHHQPVTLITSMPGNIEQMIRSDELEKALVRLNAVDEERAQIVELRYFGNLSLEETAEVVGTSVSSVTRKWRSSRAWLAANIEQVRNFGEDD
ncbi:MAG: ECF-type sigma factor [Pseudomonadota bacterium]